MLNLKEMGNMFSDNLLKDTPYFEAVVIDNNDTEGYNRVKVHVKGLTTNIDGSEMMSLDLLPWYPVLFPVSSSGNAVKSLPPIGSRVLVEYPSDDIYHGVIVSQVVSKSPQGF